MTAILDVDESNLVEAWLAAGGYSENYKRNARSALGLARDKIGRPFPSWTNDDGLAYKKWVEETLHGRSPRIRVQQVRAFFDWAADTGRVPVTPKGEPIAMAGVKPINAEDPKKPTLRIEDYALLVDTLERRAHSPHSTRREKADCSMLLWSVRLVKKWDLRGGELLAESAETPKKVCDCKADEWCPLPAPKTHDVNFVAGGRAWLRIKGSPRKQRFKEVRGTPEEMSALQEIMARPRWGLEQFDSKLKELQKELGIKLVTRAGTESDEPLTSHTFRRTVHRELTKAKVPESIQNKMAGWSERSQQSRRYGEPSDFEAQEVTKDILDFEGRVKKEARRKKKEAGEPSAEKPA